MDNFVGTKLNSRRLARRAKGRMPEVSPLAAYAQLGLVNKEKAGTRARGVRKGIPPLAIPAAEGRKKPSRSDGQGRSPASGRQRRPVQRPQAASAAGQRRPNRAARLARKQ